jgi:hypothetical protein
MPIGRFEVIGFVSRRNSDSIPLYIVIRSRSAMLTTSVGSNTVVEYAVAPPSAASTTCIVSPPE